MVEIIVGFHNKANYDFVVDTLDASFRFPMDFNYHMQNFTAVAYDYTVKPGQHGSILYAFIPHEAFGSRSYGLAVQLTYHDLVIFLQGFIKIRKKMRKHFFGWHFAISWRSLDILSHIAFTDIFRTGIITATPSSIKRSPSSNWMKDWMGKPSSCTSSSLDSSFF